MMESVCTYLVRHEDVEGEAEGDDENGENDDDLEESLEDLHKHHHVDAEEVEPSGQ